ncbi:uncharacterized protein LOC105629342 isoform X2 [Jatropha curcas]|uniref:uncharacterized protein LOC105629342 isoform X2 n=1 Tax=Jatropha curcas TaxID=180498 RepID=UPI0009D74495|nr:uncharacterized protein LOC105629342 isoform X2 [Jatropha curcas]
MAVDANFAFLFEKVEDPWLPPTTWESISSQNGARLSSSYPPNSSPTQPSPPPLHLPSSVSEASLVKLALNAMQGVESALVSIQKLSSAFCTDPADRSHHRIPSLWNRSSSTQALGKILNSIGCLGSLVFLLRKFVDNFMYMNVDVDCDSGVQTENQLSHSLVNQAFAVAIGKILEGYICALNTVYTSARLRRSSNTDVPLPEFDEEVCLMSVVHSKVTLLEVYLHTKELRTQIEELGNICNLYNISLCFSVSSLVELTAKAAMEFSNFYKGGDLLSYLCMQLQIADPAHCALLKFLFVRSYEPYCGFIRSWIFKAEISDPYKEFIVECDANLPTDLHCKDGTHFNFPLANIRDGVAVPLFLKDFLIPIIRTGQQLQVLKKLLELCNYAGSGDYIFGDFLPSFNGYLSDNLFSASPLAFSKEHLEALVTARSNYYRRMQDKLGNLFTKLEFRPQQVVPWGAVPTIFDKSGGGLQSEISFCLNDGAIAPSTGEKWGLNMAVEKIGSNSTRDEFYWLDTSEASDCSSSSSEEQTDSEQLTECPGSLPGLEDRYLSSLRFSMNSPIDNTLEKSIPSSHDMEIIFPENSQKNSALGDVSYHEKKALSRMLVPLELGNSNMSCIFNTQQIDRLTDERWPLAIPSNPFYHEGYRNYQRSDLSKSAQKLNKTDIVSMNECLPCFNKMASTQNVPIQALGDHRLENGFHISDSFTLQSFKVNYHNNFLSANPMLRKNAFFHQINKPGHKFSLAYGQPLPYFDFSTVEDPCKVSAEKLAASLRQEFGPQIPSYDTAGRSSDKDKQDYSGDGVLIDNARISCPFSPLDLKEQDQRALVSTSVFDGKTWESLLNSISHAERESSGEQKENLSSLFEIPLDVTVDKCLLQEILVQYKYVSKLAIKMLEGFDLHEHLLALRRYCFMELADWADLFIMSLWHHRWCATEADQRISEIQGFLELSVQRSSCERDPNKDRLFVYVKENAVMPLSTSAIGVHSFDFLGLGYRVDWPVSIVLTPSALKIYADIFNFLIQVKLAVFSLTDIWCLLKNLTHLIGKNSYSAIHEKEVAQFNMLVKMRHRVNHFISSLQQYVQSQLSHISWCRFLHNLKYKVKDMMDLESLHMEYLSESLHICFLSDETRSVASIIESILQCALDFHSSLTARMWDVGMDQNDSLGKLSRINISQVLAIKQKFDKNLKELHLCYLKSPRHGKFGLSCFWGYLNYNEYYS